jgi:protein-tyrosine phosphatase
MISFLFVCAGNICRSPALAACLQKLINEHGLSDKVFVDSCALTPSFLGAPADPRIVAAAHKRGVHIDHKAKLFEQAYFKVFNYILAVNHESLKKLQEMAQTDEEKAKIHLASEFSTLFKDQDMADPYFNGEEGFEKILDMSEEVAREIFSKLINLGAK